MILTQTLCNWNVYMICKAIAFGNNFPKPIKSLFFIFPVEIWIEKPEEKIHIFYINLMPMER